MKVTGIVHIHRDRGRIGKGGFQGVYPRDHCLRVDHARAWQRPRTVRLRSNNYPTRCSGSAPSWHTRPDASRAWPTNSPDADCAGNEPHRQTALACPAFVRAWRVHTPFKKLRRQSYHEPLFQVGEIGFGVGAANAVAQNAHKCRVWSCSRRARHVARQRGRKSAPSCTREGVDKAATRRTGHAPPSSRTSPCGPYSAVHGAEMNPTAVPAHCWCGANPPAYSRQRGRANNSWSLSKTAVPLRPTNPPVGGRNSSAPEAFGSVAAPGARPDRLCCPAVRGVVNPGIRRSDRVPAFQVSASAFSRIVFSRRRGSGKPPFSQRRSATW